MEGKLHSHVKDREYTTVCHPDAISLYLGPVVLIKLEQFNCVCSFPAYRWLFTFMAIGR